MPGNIKNAIITGATGGIGRALVRGFYDAGYSVIATDIGAKPNDLICKTYISADLVRYVQDQTYADFIGEQLQRELNGSPLHVLINNAAIQILGGADNLTRQDWKTTLEINLLAPFLLTQALIPKLEAAKGCVINIGSIHARLTKKDFVAYSTSKAALAGMTRALSVDVGNKFRVNAIEPAAIETEMLISGFSKNPELYKNLQSYHPIQRIGTTKEITSTALWLASEECAFVHGECIRVDGGISNRLHDPC